MWEFVSNWRQGDLAIVLVIVLMLALVGWDYFRGNSVPNADDKPIANLPPVPATDWRLEQSVFEQPEKFGYQVFTNEYDRVVEAADLDPKKGVTKRERRLANIIRANEQVTERLCELLKARGVGDQLGVSILIDHSGSMNRRAGTGPEEDRQGGSIVTDDSGAALCAGAALSIATAVEACGATTEILGFTTREWRGGSSRKEWLKAGKPPQPGRLNDLLHIIYKRADESSVAACTNRLEVMLLPETLKENIDGEAVAWARGRLLAQPATDRLLIVVSDGAPVDDSTLNENAANYLERHLLHVLDDINHRDELRVVGIGIGYDISRYISRSVIVDFDESKLEDQIDQISNLIVDSDNEQS